MLCAIAGGVGLDFANKVGVALSTVAGAEPVLNDDGYIPYHCIYHFTTSKCNAKPMMPHEPDLIPKHFSNDAMYAADFPRLQTRCQPKPKSNISLEHFSGQVHVPRTHILTVHRPLLLLLG